MHAYVLKIVNNSIQHLNNKHLVLFQFSHVVHAIVCGRNTTQKGLKLFAVNGNLRFFQTIEIFAS